MNMENDSFQSQWLIEGHILLVTAINNLTASMLYHHDHETMKLMNTLIVPLHIIADVRALKSFPSLQDCLNVQSLHHPSMGWLLTVGATQSPMRRFFLNALIATTQLHYRDFDDVTAALAYLEQAEPYLKGSLVT